MPADIDIRSMNEEEFVLSKKLWLECFPEDGDDFVELYYSNRTKPEYALGAFDAMGEPVAMLHMIPVDMRFGERTERVCLVSGVCTKPGLRRRGYCARLFEEAFAIMKERGFAATVLQPFRVGFYERFGYRFFVSRNVVSVPKEMLEPHSSILPKCPEASKLLNLYELFTKGCSGCTVRDEKYFESFIKEYSLPGAELIMTERGCCAGYGEDGGEVFSAAELFFLPGCDPLSLLPEGYAEYKLPLPWGCPLPECAGSVSEPFLMIKPLSPEFDIGSGPFYGFDRY